MSTVQIVGIAVAAAVVILLIVALLVTRHHSKSRETAQASDSFLDSAPQDTLARLGKAEQPVEDVTLDPTVERASTPIATPSPREQHAAADDLSAVPPVPLAQSHAVPADIPDLGGDDLLQLDWGAASTDFERTDEIPTANATSPAQAAAPTATASVPTSTITESGTSSATPTPARPAEGGSAADSPAAQESGAGGRWVPLSDILVTTNDKLIDLEDREVRRMLTDLVKYESDQATAFRAQGRNVDAVLQLTEAEKVSRALGMPDSAAAIRRMMDDLKGSV